MIAAACGDDSGERAAEATTTTVPDDTTTTTTTEPVELTASFRGVTPEIIRVGISTFDWDRLAEMGVRGGIGNSDDIYIAMLDAINDRGGINGRMLELYPIAYLPVGATEADAACVEWTEDHEVFVVVGGVLGDDILCLTELNDTAAVMVGGMTAERRERSTAPYATVDNEAEERASAFVETMDRLDLLDGKTIGVTGSSTVGTAGYHFTLEALRDAGYSPIEGLTGANDDDLAATARDAAVIYELFRSSGVNLTISTTGVPLEIANAIEAGYESDQWLLVNSMSGRSLIDADVDLAHLDGAYSVNLTAMGTPAQETLSDDPSIAARIDEIETRTGRTISYALDVEVSALAQSLAACGLAAILEAGLTNAGPVLTNDSFQAGLEAIGPIDLPGYPQGNLGPGDLSASSTFVATQFNAADAVWELVE